MQQIQIKIRSFLDVQELVAMAADKPYGVFLADSRCNVSAKRFLSVSSLDLSQVLTLTLDCNGAEAASFIRHCGHLVEK